MDYDTHIQQVACNEYNNKDRHRPVFGHANGDAVGRTKLCEGVFSLEVRIVGVDCLQRLKYLQHRLPERRFLRWILNGVQYCRDAHLDE